MTSFSLRSELERTRISVLFLRIQFYRKMWMDSDPNLALPPSQIFWATNQHFWSASELGPRNRSNFEWRPIFCLVFIWILAEKTFEFRVKTWQCACGKRIILPELQWTSNNKHSQSVPFFSESLPSAFFGISATRVWAWILPFCSVITRDVEAEAGSG